MKVWGLFFASLLLTQISCHEDDSPCNGYPEYRDMPINQNFYLGTTIQTNDISQLLKQGIRYFDIPACKNENNDISICNSDISLKSVLNSAFDYSRESVEQFFILNLNTNIDSNEIEDIINNVCESHTKLVEGVNEFVKGECEFIYAYKNGPWSTPSDILNYHPDMAQWEGDGEDVGIRTKFMLTNSNNQYKNTAYFSPAFWRSVESVNVLSKECKMPKGGIQLKLNNIEDVEDVLLKDCNLNDSPLNTFFNTILLNDIHQQHYGYLKDLERRMMDLNFAKWTGNYALLEQSTVKFNKVQRDEL